jgi:hypothetical protein
MCDRCGIHVFGISFFVVVYLMMIGFEAVAWESDISQLYLFVSWDACLMRYAYHARGGL